MTEAGTQYSAPLRALRAAAAGHPLFPALFAATLAFGRFAVGLGSREISLLEAQDLSVAAELLRTFRLSADHSPLHFLFLNLWLHVGGGSVVLVRLPSALFVAAAAGVVFRLAQRVGGLSTAVWAVLLFASNPEVVDQARSLRLYGLGILLAAVCLERAEAFACRGRGEALGGFLATAVIAVHTHLFLWLWVAPLAALVAVRALLGSGGATRRRAGKAFIIALVLAVPQVAHGVAALAFTHDRHALYRGVSPGALTFLDEIGRHLLLGEAPEVLPTSGFALLCAAVLPVLGARSLPRGLRRAVVFVCGLPFLVTFALSFVSEVEARYLCFALPGLAILSALGIAALPAALGQGLAVAIAAVSILATTRAYGPPASDWQLGAKRLEALVEPGDVVAVFPGYWAATLRFYTRVPELVPVTYPIDLERALLRARRVLLVVNGGRYAGDLDAYTEAYTERRALFATEVRRGFEVDSVRFTAPRATVPEHAPATVVFAGIVASGGYPWMERAGSVHALERLLPLFSSADIAVAGYAPLEPPLPAALLRGLSLGAPLRPNRTVTDALDAAGVGAVVLSGAFGDPASAATVLETAQVATVPAQTGAMAVNPLVLDAAGERIALVSLADATGRDLSDAHLTSVVAETRAALRPTDALVVFVPTSARFDALPTDAERRTAQRLVEAGADVVIGNGNRQAEPLERYEQGVIAYSLGTLLFPPSFELVAREATGAALRVQFAGGRAVRTETIPLGFDDQARPALGRADAAPSDIAPGFAPVVAGLAQARVSLVGPRGSQALVYSRAEPVSSANELLDRELERWLPWSPRGTSPRPFDACFAGGGAVVGVRGVRSLGVPRAALELDAPPGTTLKLDLPPLSLGRRLALGYALPDDREQSKYRPFLAEALRVSVEDGPSVDLDVPYRAGFQFATLDTSTLRGSSRRVRVELSSPATHFPVAVELRLEP